MQLRDQNLLRAPFVVHSALRQEPHLSFHPAIRADGIDNNVTA